MPVAVSVPIRIRLDADAAYDQLDELDDAFDAATGRALGRAVHVANEARWHNWHVVVHEPTFGWSGDGLRAVDAHQRERIEAVVSDRLNQLIAHARLERAPRRVRRPLSEPAIEDLDPTRFTDGVAFYEIPSYHTGGAPRAIPVKRKAPPAAPVVHPVWAPNVVTHRMLTDSAYRRQQLDEAVKYYGHVPQATYVGVIWKDGHKLDMLFHHATERGPNYGLSFTPLPQRNLGPDGKFGDSPVGGLPDPDFATLVIVAPAGTKEQRIEAIRLAMGPGIKAQLLSRHKPHTAKVDEFLKQVDDDTEREIKVRAKKLPDNTAYMVQLQIGGRTYDGIVPGEVPIWHGTVGLIPLIHLAPGEGPRRGQTGTGGGGGTGEGEQGTGTPGQPGTGGEGDGEGRGEEDGKYGILLGTKPVQEGALFPHVPGTYGDLPECESFLGEAELDKLGDDAKWVEAAMKRIDRHLDLAWPCFKYPGFFCLQAASAIGARAAQIGTYASSERHVAFTRANPTRTANLGYVDFQPVVSPAIQFMRHLATVVPEIDALARGLASMYESHPDRLSGTYEGNGAGWALHLYIELTDRLNPAIARLFGETCRVLLLQLLRSSLQAIRARLDHLTDYARQFLAAILPALERVTDLIELRDRLKAKKFEELRLASSQATPYMRIFHHEQVPADTDFIKNDQGFTVRIRDARSNRTWTEEELENAIQLRRGVVEEIDPLVKQMSDLPEQVAKFRASQTGLWNELFDILAEMVQHNREITTETEGDWEYAFRASQISEDLPNATIPGGRYELHGIHLQAHEAIGEFFNGSRWYATATDAMFSGELGKKSLIDFFEFTGLVFLSVVCPPAAFVVGVGLALHTMAEAEDKAALYGALIDPEQIISRAEVEAELFAAKLGLALAFIPDAPAIAKGGIVGARVALEEGVMAGARSVFGAVRQSAMRAMAHALEKGLIETFVKECVKAEMINLVVERVMTPVIEDIEREVQATGPVGGLPGLMSRLAQRHGGGGGGAR